MRQIRGKYQPEVTAGLRGVCRRGRYQVQTYLPEEAFGLLKLKAFDSGMTIAGITRLALYEFLQRRGTRL